MPEIDRHVHFEVFKSSFKSWNLCLKKPRHLLMASVLSV
jgi:hypothetical protein